jgi:23S rRNA (cytidine2498-2'-O)-methyltransferase
MLPEDSLKSSWNAICVEKDLGGLVTQELNLLGVKHHVWDETSAKWVWIRSQGVMQEGLPCMAKLVMKQVHEVRAESINQLAGGVMTALIELFKKELKDETQPWQWSFILDSSYGANTKAGKQRVELISKTILQKLKEKWRKAFTAYKVSSDHCKIWVRLMLVRPDLLIWNIQRDSQKGEPLSHLPCGHVEPAYDLKAPARAFAKLIEAQVRMKQKIRAQEVCVDLGASPGSWTYVAVNQGARVIALDRSALRNDLMRHSKVKWLQADAFEYQPSQQVDWLLCDVIAEPERSIDLIEQWIAKKWCRYFVVTIKFKGDINITLLHEFIEKMNVRCHRFFLKKLTVNKNEVTAMGWL